MGVKRQKLLKPFCNGFVCYLFQLSEQEVETVLDKCMVLFRFLQEKVTEDRDHGHLCLNYLSSVEMLPMSCGTNVLYSITVHLYNTQGRI